MQILPTMWAGACILLMCSGYRMCPPDSFVVANKGLDFLAQTEGGEDKDTTIIAPNGTKLHLNAGTFPPFTNREVHIEIHEFLGRCDRFGMDIHMQSTEGEYLISDGMFYLTARKDGKSIQPQKPIEIWMPGTQTDTVMRLYTTSRQPDGKVLWKKLSNDIDYHISRNRFYSFSITKTGWYNIQKPVNKEIAELFIPNPKDKKSKKTKYIIKNKSQAHPLLRVVYIDVNNYYELPEGEEGYYSMAKYNTPENTVLIGKVQTPENKTWYFAKRISELEHKKGVYYINTEDYIVRRKSQKPYLISQDAPPTDELLSGLCKRMFK